MDKPLKFIFDILEKPHLAIFATFVLFVLVSIPSKNVAEISTLNDKISHLLAFGVLTLLWLFTNWSKKFIIMNLLAYGVFIELWQSILPISFHRSGEFADILADFLGVGIGVFIFYLISLFKKLT